MSESLAENEDIIWHYTSREVFANLLEKRTGLYATHYKFLNDSMEYEYGHKIIKEYMKYINEHIDKLSQGNSFGETFDRKELCIIKEDWNWEKIELPYKDMFTLCFSRKPDKLYQWRSYTPNGGYSIGFSKSEIIELFKTNLSYDQLDNIYIDEEENGEIYFALLDDCIYDIEKIKRCSGAFLYQGERRKKFLAKVFVLSKHSSFRDEEETRIAIFGDSLRRHIEIVGGKPRIPIVGCDKGSVANLIKGVYVSPHGDREGNKLFAELLKEKHNLSFEICCSDSPYVGG